MPQPTSPPDPARPAPAGQGPATTAPAGAPAEAAHPADPAHDLSDSPIHARSPDEYTEEPGSHRREADGPALDVGA